MTWKFMNKASVLVASEAGNYGVSPALNSTNFKGVIAANPQVRPRGETIRRDFVRDSFTPFAPIAGRKQIECSFETELKASNNATNPETATTLHTLLKACRLAAGSWTWRDNAAANPTACAKVYWVEIINSDNAHEVHPYWAGWLVEDRAGVPVNRRAVVIGQIRRKSADGDTGHRDCLIVALDTETPALDLAKTQELSADNGNVPAVAVIATAYATGGSAVIKKGSALRPTSDYATIHGASVSLAYFLDGILHQSPGCLGSFSINLQDNQTPRLQFSYTGLYGAPSDTAVPAGVTFATWQPPTVYGEDLTLAHVKAVAPGLDQVYKPAFSRLSYDMRNNVRPAVDLNQATGVSEILCSGGPAQMGVDPAVDTLANLDPWTPWGAGDTRVLTLCMGYANVGNRVALMVPQAAHADTPSYQDRDGLAAYQWTLQPSGDVDDELVIVFG